MKLINSLQILENSSKILLFHIFFIIDGAVHPRPKYAFNQKGIQALAGHREAKKCLVFW
jgi:hypothetical protein